MVAERPTALAQPRNLMPLVSVPPRLIYNRRPILDRSGRHGGFASGNGPSWGDRGMPTGNQPGGGSPAQDLPETRSPEGESNGPDPRQPIHESDTIIGGQ